MNQIVRNRNGFPTNDVIITEAGRQPTVPRPSVPGPRSPNRNLPSAPPESARSVSLTELDSKYKNFRDHFAIYEQGFKAYLMIGRMLRSRESTVTWQDGMIIRSANRLVDDFQEDHEQSWFNLCPRLGSSSNQEFTHLDFIKDAKGEWVETQVSLPPIQVKIGFGPRASANCPAFLNAPYPAVLDRINRIMNSFFPQFELPTKLRKIEVANSVGRFKQTQFQFAQPMEAFNSLVGLTGLEKIRPPYTPDTKDPESSAKYFRLSDDYRSKFCNKDGSPIVRQFLQLEIDPNAYTINGLEQLLGNEQRYPIGAEVDLNDLPQQIQQGSINIAVNVKMVLRWPLEFALYVTSAGTKKDFLPFAFLQYATWHKVAYSQARRKRTDKKGAGKVKLENIAYSKSDLPVRVSHLGRIVETIADRKRKGAKVEPRTNEDDFTILGSAESSYAGEVLWVPRDANNVSALLEQMQRSYNPESKQVDLSSFSMRNQALFSDWYFDKFTFIRVAGVGANSTDLLGVQTFDLMGSIPLDETTILRELRANFFTDDTVAGGKKLPDEFISALTRYLREGGTAARWLNLELYEKTPELEPLGKYLKFLRRNPTADMLSEMLRYLDNTRLTPMWGNLGGMPFLEADKNIMGVPRSKRTFVNSYSHIDADGMAEIEKNMGQGVTRFHAAIACLRLIEMICADMLANFDSFDIAFSSKVHWLRFRLVLITKYAKQYAHIEKVAAERQAKITDVDRNNMNIDNVTFPNLPGVEVVMPHQIETWNVLDTKPEGAMVGVAPGGGKTLISLRDVMQLLYEKRGKRCLIILPNRLVRGWVNEVRKFSKNMINPLPLTNVTYETMNDAFFPEYSGVFNTDLIKRMVETAPINTVFLTDFVFLRSKVEDVLYGTQMVRRYPVAELFRDLGFDVVLIDESHFAKNIDSNQTAAVSIIAANAEFIRELSGTIVVDTLVDVIGQTSLVNPAVFGNKRSFIDKFSDVTVGKTVTQWQPDAIQAVAQGMVPYLQKIDHKRHRWAFALPDMVEEFHPVSMTPRQQLFYDKWVENKISEIKDNDPALFAKLKAGNESDAPAIESKLAQHFAPLEQFVYAPDSFDAFKEMFGWKSDRDLGVLTKEDLISPKVGKVIELLDRHFNGYIDPATKTKMAASRYKVIIFSHRLVTSEHMYRNLPEHYKKKAVRYTAGDQKALDAFEKNPDVQIFVADELSVNAGQNLQMASRLIRLETLWSPGNQEQASARIWRPDNFESIDATSKRGLVHLDWVYTDQSLEVPKIGRIVSKMISKFIFDRLDDKDFTDRKFRPENWWHDAFGKFVQFPREGGLLSEHLMSLDLIIMNFETFQEIKYSRQLYKYFGTYALMQEFERQQFEREKASGRQQFVKVPAENYVTLPGSARLAFAPRVAGIHPAVFDPEDKMGYKPISFLESEDMDDTATVFSRGDSFDTEFGVGTIEKVGKDTLMVNVDNYGLIEVKKPVNRFVDNADIQVVEGETLVDTEFGFGVVHKIQTNHVRVFVPGLGNVRVQKATTWAITNPDAQAKVQQALRQAGKKGLPRLIGQIEGQAPVDLIDQVKVKPLVVQRDDGSISLRPVTQPTTVNPPAPLSPSGKRGPRVGLPPAPRPNPVQAPAPLDNEDFDFDFDTPAAPPPRLSPRTNNRLPQQQRSPVKQFFDETVDVETNQEIYVFAEIVDGQVALAAVAADVDSEVLVDNFGFKNFPPYVAVKFPLHLPQLLEKFLARASQSFKIAPHFIENLMIYLDLMKRRKLQTAKPEDFQDSMRFVVVDVNRPTPEGTLKPYPVVWGNTLFICAANVSQRTASVLRQIGKSVGLPGANPVSMQENINIRLFRSREAALSALQAIQRVVTVPNAEETAEFLRKVKIGGKSTDLEQQPSLISPRGKPVKNGDRKMPPAPKPAVVRVANPVNQTTTVRNRGTVNTKELPPPRRPTVKPLVIDDEDDVDFSSILTPVRGPRR